MRLGGEAFVQTELTERNANAGMSFCAFEGQEVDRLFRQSSYSVSETHAVDQRGLRFK